MVVGGVQPNGRQRDFEQGGDLPRGVVFLSYNQGRVKVKSMEEELAKAKAALAAAAAKARKKSVAENSQAPALSSRALSRTVSVSSRALSRTASGSSRQSGSSATSPVHSPPGALRHQLSTRVPLTQSRSIKHARSSGAFFVPEILEELSEEQEEASAKEASDQQVHIAYFVETGLGLCDRFSALKNLQIACLCANRLASLGALQFLPHLRILDVSDNSVQFVVNSSAGNPTGFRRLSVLYLHRNLVRRAHGLEGLTQAIHLRVLTLYGNPISRDEYYRPSVFNAVPSVLALDGHPKIPHDFFISASSSEDPTLDTELVALARKHSDVQAHAPISEKVTTVHSDPLQVLKGIRTESLTKNAAESERQFKIKILKARNPRHQNRELMVGWALNRFLMRCRLSLPTTYLTLGTSSPPEDFKSVQDETLSSIHRLYSACNPALVVQRCLRGHYGRKHYRKYRIRIMMPTVVLQRMVYAKRISKQLALLSSQGASNSKISSLAADRILEGLPLSSDGAIYENVWSSSDLYFLPEDVLKLESILLAVKFIFPEGMRPILQVSNLVLYQATGGSISHWVPYFRVTAKREFRKRSLGQACRMCFLRHGVDSASPFSRISRRGMTCSTAHTRSLSEAFSAQNSPSVKDSVDTYRHWLSSSAGGMKRRYMLVLRFSSQHSRGLFVRVLSVARAHLSDPPPKFVLQEVVARMVAASTIQCTVRAWLQRRRMRPCLGTAVFALRAIRLIQRWWRWGSLKLRLKCLGVVHRALLNSSSSKVLYCFANNIKKRFEEDSASPTIFREGRFCYDFDSENAIFVHSSSLDKRPFLPHWVGTPLQIPPLSDGVMDDDTEVQLQPLRADVPRQGEGEHSNMKAILQIGCEVSLASTVGSSVWECPDQEKAWKLPRRNLLASTPVLRMSFSTPTEAHRRMGFLICRTFRPRSRDPVRLVDVNNAAKHVFAMYIQAVFRGFLTRRWWRLIAVFLKKRLHTTFFEERSCIRSQESAPEEAQWKKMPESWRQIMKHLKITPKALWTARVHPEDTLGSRIPKLQLPRDGHKFPSAICEPTRPNAPGIVISTALMTGAVGYGGGLPGGVTSVADRKMSNMKCNVDLNKAEQDRFKGQTAFRARSDQFSMKVFEILQPRRDKVRGYSSQELQQIRDRVQLHKAVHAEQLQLNKEAKGDHISRRRQERTQERHLAVFAQQVYKAAWDTTSIIQERVQVAFPPSSPKQAGEGQYLAGSANPFIDAADRAVSPASSQTSLHPHGTVRSEVEFAGTDRPGYIRMKTPLGGQRPVEFYLPTLMSRPADKIAERRSQSVAKAAADELKAQSLMIKRQAALSVQRASEGIIARKKAEVLKQKHLAEALRMNRFHMDEKWQKFVQEKKLKNSVQTASKFHPGTASTHPLPDTRRHGKIVFHTPVVPHSIPVPRIPSATPGAWERFCNEEDNCDEDMWVVDVQSMQEIHANAGPPGAHEAGAALIKKRPPITEERPLSATARDPHLPSRSGVNLVINLEQARRGSVRPSTRN